MGTEESRSICNNVRRKYHYEGRPTSAIARGQPETCPKRPGRPKHIITTTILRASKGTQGHPRAPKGAPSTWSGSDEKSALDKKKSALDKIITILLYLIRWRTV